MVGPETEGYGTVWFGTVRDGKGRYGQGDKFGRTTVSIFFREKKFRVKFHEISVTLRPSFQSQYCNIRRRDHYRIRHQANNNNQIEL